MATLGCSTTRVLYNAPVAGTRNAGEPSTSSISRLHLRGRLSNKKLSLKLAGRWGLNDGIGPLVRASLSNEGDDVRELASEKAVETGRQVAQDTNKLANGQSPVVFDAKTEDVLDAASYESDVREKVVDVASDMAVDTTDDVDTLAKKDATPLADSYGRSVEDTADALEAKAAEVGDREFTKESDESQGSSGSFFKDQVVKGDTSFRKIGDQFEGLKRTFSKNLQEGIDSNRPGFEELSRNASKSVKAGREYLDDAGVTDISEDAQTVLEDAKGALDKRQSAVSLAVEDARETGSMVAELAAKGWDALSKKTEKFVAKFQKNAGELQVTAQEKVEEARQRAEVTADQAQSKFAEVKLKAEEATDQAQSKFAETKLKAEDAADQAQKQFAEAKSNLQAKSDALRDTAQDKATESRANLEKTVDEAQRKFNETRDNAQAKTAELEDTAQEKASESQSKLEDTAEAAQSKAGELSSEFEEKAGDVKENVESEAGDVKENVESKAGDVKENVESKTGDVKENVESKAEDVSKGSESSVIEPTQGAESSVQYWD